jgi:hypothetical protein
MRVDGRRGPDPLFRAIGWIRRGESPSSSDPSDMSDLCGGSVEEPGNRAPRVAAS